MYLLLSSSLKLCFSLYISICYIDPTHEARVDLFVVVRVYECERLRKSFFLYFFYAATVPKAILKADHPIHDWISSYITFFRQHDCKRHELKFRKKALVYEAKKKLFEFHCLQKCRCSPPLYFHLIYWWIVASIIDSTWHIPHLHKELLLK